MDDLGVMTNNGGAVVNLLGDLLAMLGDDVLALLNVGGVHHGLAHGPGDLLGIVLGDLVALLLHVLVALGACGVNLAVAAMASLPLAVTALAVSSIVADDLGVVTHHVRALVDLGVDLLAVLGDNLLALLGVGGVDLHVILLMTLLPLLLDGLLVTLPLVILATLGTA